MVSPSTPEFPKFSAVGVFKREVPNLNRINTLSPAKPYQSELSWIIHKGPGCVMTPKFPKSVNTGMFVRLFPKLNLTNLSPRVQVANASQVVPSCVTTKPCNINSPVKGPRSVAVGVLANEEPKFSLTSVE